MVEGELALNGLSDTGAVVDKKAIAIGTDGKRGIQHLGIGQGLLHTMADCKDLFRLASNDSERQVRDAVENIIRALGPPLASGFSMRAAILPRTITRPSVSFTSSRN